MRCLVVLLLGLAAGLAAPPSAAQQAYPLEASPDTTGALYSSSRGLVFRLDAYGFGLGLATRTRATDNLSLTVELGLGTAKDEREQQFFVGFFGDTVTPLKRNYVLLMPLHVGAEQRLFRDTIAPNFRPFMHAAVGPTLAYEWPYFDDRNNNGIRENDEGQLGAFRGFGEGTIVPGLGGTLALGAYLGDGTSSAQGIRFGFSGHLFSRPINLLEPREDVSSPDRRFFATPLLTVHLVRFIN